MDRLELLYISTLATFYYYTWLCFYLASRGGLLFWKRRLLELQFPKAWRVGLMKKKLSKLARRKAAIVRSGGAQQLSRMSAFGFCAAILTGTAAAQQATETVQLDTISVEGTQTAYSAVNGYRATRSATGTKTDTPLRETPQTINVVPRDVLVDQQDVTLTQALMNVSNVQPAGTLGGRTQTYNLRGFNTQTFAVDGLLMNPAMNFATVNRDLANAERVEVLKGPASVLYGRGDPGGIINIVTRRPTFDPTAEATIMGGSFGYKRFQGSASSAIAGSDQIAGRLTFAAEGDPTFRNFDGAENRKYYIAPSLSWNPSPDTRVYFTSENTLQNSQYDEGLLAVNGRVPTYSRSTYYGEPWSRFHGEAYAVTLRAEHDVNEHLMLRQVLNYQFGGFNQFVVRATGVNATTGIVTRRDTTTNNTMRAFDSQTEAVAKFDTYGLAHTALLGFEYVNGYRDSYSNQSAAGVMPSINLYNPVYGAAKVPMLFQNDIQQTNRMYGTYLQDQIVLTPGLQLVTGVRMDVVNQFYWNRTTATGISPNDQNLLGISPRAGLVFDPTTWLTLYASYSESFTPQTANVINASNPPPETGQQYEVGAKADLIPDMLSATFAAFIINKQNVAANDPVNTGFSVITGAQKSRGFDFDVTGQILPGWKVIGGIGFTDAKITSDTTYRVGNWLTGVPRISGSVWSTYQVQEGTFKGLGFGAGVTYVGRRYGDLNDSFVVGQYARLDAAIFYDFKDHYRLALNARNLTNAHYIEQPYNQFNNAPGAPISVLASLTGRF